MAETEANHDRDIESWINFFDQFDIQATINERPDASDIDGNIHYVLYPETDSIDVDWVDGNPVIPVDDAVEQMSENRVAYEPALEIIAKNHDIAIDPEHHQTNPAN